MNLNAATKQEIIAQYKVNEKDTGSPEVQIALITKRISDLEIHLKVHKKDFATKKSLLILIAKRNTFLRYLAKSNKEKYIVICKELNLRAKLS